MSAGWRWRAWLPASWVRQRWSSRGRLPERQRRSPYETSGKQSPMQSPKQSSPQPAPASSFVLSDDMQPDCLEHHTPCSMQASGVTVRNAAAHRDYIATLAENPAESLVLVARLQPAGEQMRAQSIAHTAAMHERHCRGQDARVTARGMCFRLRLVSGICRRCPRAGNQLNSPGRWGGDAVIRAADARKVRHAAAA
jgi:hypothetical protein